MSDTWPKHQDGRNKKIGEMTPDERKRVARESVAVIKAEFEDPRHQAAIKAYLEEDAEPDEAADRGDWECHQRRDA